MKWCANWLRPGDKILYLVKNIVKAINNKVVSYFKVNYSTILKVYKSNKDIYNFISLITNTTNITTTNNTTNNSKSNIKDIKVVLLLEKDIRVKLKKSN